KHFQAARRDPATPPASWPLPLGHHGACERLRRSRSRLPIAGRALRVVERGGEVLSATQAPCKPSRENGSIAVRADARTEFDGKGQSCAAEKSGARTKGADEVVPVKSGTTNPDAMG